MKKIQLFWEHCRSFHVLFSAISPDIRRKIFVRYVLLILSSLFFLGGPLFIMVFVGYGVYGVSSLKQAWMLDVHDFVLGTLELNFFWVLGVLSLLFASAASFSGALSVYIRHSIQQLLSYHSKTALYRYYIQKKVLKRELPLGVITDIIIRRSKDVTVLWVMPILLFLSTSFFLAISFFLVYLVEPSMFWFVVTLSILLLLLPISLTHKNIRRLARKTNRLRTKIQQNILQTMAISEDIYIYNKKSHFSSLYEHNEECLKKTDLEKQKIKAVYSPLSEIFLYNIIVIGFFLLTAFSVSLEPGIIVFLVVILYRVIPKTNSLFKFFTLIREGSEVYRSIDKHLLEALLAEIKPDRAASPLLFVDLLLLKKITYCYRKHKERKPFAIKNLTMAIKAGTSVSVCGKSGSGKSTLLRIMSGMLPPNQGKISVDGIVLDNEVVMGRWQDTIGFVTSSGLLTDGSVAQNIALSFDRASFDESRIFEALRIVEANFVVNPYEDAVVRLSEGQKQRILIARALYHHSRVLLLDEATNALDKDSELRIFNRLRESEPTMTIVYITHRLETCQLSDEVIMMDEGEIILTGSYTKVSQHSYFKQLAGEMSSQELL